MSLARGVKVDERAALIGQADVRERLADLRPDVAVIDLRHVFFFAT